jgi:hypothetical protein
MTAIRLLVLVTLFLAATPFVHATATTFDGNELLSKCEAAERWVTHQGTDDDPANGSYCLGFIDGVMLLATDTTVRLVDSDHRSSLPCAPAEGLTTGQAMRVVLKYLNSHPETLHKSAQLLVVLALREAFPCK